MTLIHFKKTGALSSSSVASQEVDFMFKLLFLEIIHFLMQFLKAGAFEMGIIRVIPGRRVGLLMNIPNQHDISFPETAEKENHPEQGSAAMKKI